jgi:hypothetical protein
LGSGTPLALFLRRRTIVAKLMWTLVIALGAWSGLAYAQDVERKSKTKITVEDGKEVTVTGCVARQGEDGFVLTQVTSKDGALGSYTLVADDDDDDEFEELEDHVGHRVEIKGKAADKGSGKVKIESKSEVEAGGDSRKRESTTRVEGDLQGFPFLGVKELRMIAAVCP